MGNQIVIQRGRTNIVMVALGMDISADTFMSQIRAKTASDSTLLATWDVQKVDGGIDGVLQLTLDDAISATIVANSGYMDLKRISGGEPLSVFESPVEVIVKGVITS